MEVKRKLSQILMYPLMGDASGDIELEIQMYVEKYNASLFLLSTLNLSNPADIKNTISKINKKYPDNDFIFAIHAGGGTQMPVNKNITHIPSNMTIGLSDNPENAYKIAEVMAEELKSLGINMVISDFLNINMNNYNMFVGTSSFNDTPGENAEYISNFIKAFNDTGVIICGMNFPGIGSLEEFSAVQFNTVHRGFESMFQDEILSFKKAFEEDIPVIEVSDVYYFKESKTVKEPACFSDEIIDLLRNTLQYKGIVMSSSLYRKEFSGIKPSHCVINAYKAGCNLIIMPGGLRENIEAYNGLYMEIKKGAIKERSLQKMDSYNTLKEKISSTKKTLYNIKKQNREIVQSVMKECIKYFKGRDFVYKIKDVKDILVIAPGYKDIYGEDGVNYFHRSVKYFKRKSELIEYSMNPDNSEIEKIKEEASKYEAVILYSINAHYDEGRENLGIAVSRANDNTIVVGLDSPYEFRLFEDCPCYIALCSYLEQNIQDFCEEFFK
jgi:beta-N-acetylhexosaminidase